MRFILLLSISYSSILCSCGDRIATNNVGSKGATSQNASAIFSSNVKYVDSLKESNGLVIKWANKGKGPKIQDGDLVLINYVVSLPNGKLVDGSSKITKSDLPFMVGYNMQTKGWDEVFRKMTVGDVATIIIPSELGWSDNSLGELLPANSDLIMQLFIVRKVEPAVIVNGSKIWRWSLMKNDSTALAFGPKKMIKYDLIVNSQKEAGLINTYSKKMVVSTRFEDEFQPESLKKALTNAKKNQGIFILVSPQEVAQLKDINVNPKESPTLFYNIQVSDVTKY
jgi:hypothetical protein